MSRETAFSAVRFGMENKKASGLLFYGGEPLLERKLIYEIVDYTKRLSEETGHTFIYKITTNGILLDEEFLKFARDINMSIGFSHDGPAQDDCRRFFDGKGSAVLLEEKIPLLLKYNPYAVAMSVVDPSTVHKTAEIAGYLFEKGFRYVTLNLNYDEEAEWTKEHFLILKREYKKLAGMYLKQTREERKLYFSPFDMKILSHLKGEKYHADRRLMNKEQPSVAPDGRIFPASRYIDEPLFAIGDVFSGIDKEKQTAFEQKSEIILDSCKDCALRNRCNYVYGCLFNRNGKIVSEISPVQCAHERLITPIADRLAEKLYKERNALFIHKHYNDLYPVISLTDDKS
jgi:uncharacterized protein